MREDENSPYVQAFRESLIGVPPTLNGYRERHGLEWLDNRRVLNFNAFHRATHFVEAGIGEGELTETIRPFPNQDLSDAVELVAQWQKIEEPATYLSAWINDEEARSYLLGDYKYMGIAGVTIPTGLIARPILTAVVVLVLTKTY